MSGRVVSWVNGVFLCTAVLLLICEAVSMRSRIIKTSQVCRTEVSRGKQGCSWLTWMFSSGRQENADTMIYLSTSLDTF